MNKNNWYEVDKKGLSQLLGRRSKAFIVIELVQNAWDQNISKVEITLEPIKRKRRYKLVVSDDDPEGFKDITDAFTLFAHSYKKRDPTKRGRFNLGEKLVLAFCDDAEIITTSGSVIFSMCKRRSKSAAGGGPKPRHPGPIYFVPCGVSIIFHLLNYSPPIFHLSRETPLTFSGVSGAAGSLSNDNFHHWLPVCAPGGSDGPAAHR